MKIIPAPGMSEACSAVVIERGDRPTLRQQIYELNAGDYFGLSDEAQGDPVVWPYDPMLHKALNRGGIRFDIVGGTQYYQGANQVFKKMFGVAYAAVDSNVFFECKSAPAKITYVPFTFQARPVGPDIQLNFWKDNDAVNFTVTSDEARDLIKQLQETLDALPVL